MTTKNNSQHHLKSYHGLNVSQYRKNFSIPCEPQRNRFDLGAFTKGKIGNRRIYKDLFKAVACHICGEPFVLPTSLYQRYLKKGKTRFACPDIVTGVKSKCLKALQSITIKEIRNTPESKAKTRAQMLKRWESKAWRDNFSSKIKALGPEWHEKRMTACLKANSVRHKSKPEIAVEQAIKNAGLNIKYSGDGSNPIGWLHPDFVAKDKKVCIEVLGCYWHNCPVCMPVKGYRKNLKRDARKDAVYTKHGWTCIKIWEHEVNQPGWQTPFLARVAAAMAAQQ
jgi:DNA mismatch endonuclease (patch repair protein)